MKRIQISVTATPKAKREAKAVTEKLGLSLSTALSMYVNRIALQKRLLYSTALLQNLYAKYSKPTTTSELRKRIQNNKGLN